MTRTPCRRRSRTSRTLSARPFRTGAALAGERYQRGRTSYLDVIDAQRGVFQAERDEVQLCGHQIVSTILLAKALGGGWNGGERGAAE